MFVVWLADLIAMVADVIATSIYSVLADVIAMVVYSNNHTGCVYCLADVKAICVADGITTGQHLF